MRLRLTSDSRRIQELKRKNEWWESIATLAFTGFFFGGLLLGSGLMLLIGTTDVWFSGFIVGISTAFVTARLAYKFGVDSGYELACYEASEEGVKDTESA